MERIRVRESPPGRSVRPTEPAKRVSPAISRRLLGQVETGAALGVSGGVDDGPGEAGDGDGFAVGEVVVGGGDLRSGDAEPAGLDVHHPDQRQIELVVEDGRAGEAFELLGSGDVVDVGRG